MKKSLDDNSKIIPPIPTIFPTYRVEKEKNKEVNRKKDWNGWNGYTICFLSDVLEWVGVGGIKYGPFQKDQKAELPESEASWAIQNGKAFRVEPTNPPQPL